MSTLREYVASRAHHAYRRRVEWPLAAEYAARGLSPAARMADRFERMCAAERPVILADEQIVFMRTVENLPGIFTREEWAEMKRRLHTRDFVNNICPRYVDTVSVGLLAKRAEADEYGKQVIDSIISLSDKYLAEAKRIGREDIAEVLTQVPRYPARSFREALQFFRILHYALWLEGDRHVTVGRFDKDFYPYLAADIEKGVLDEAGALALVEDFFLSFNKDSDLYPGIQRGDNGQSLMLGGKDDEGGEIFNLLTRLSLRASCNNKLIEPKINLRVSGQTPLAVYLAATELTREGLGFPQYSNDDVAIPALIRMGYEPRDAANYSVAACWEFIIPAVCAEVVNADVFSYPLALERAFLAHFEHVQSYEAFYEAVLAEIDAQVDEVTAKIGKPWFVPAPFMRLVMECDPTEGGKYHNVGLHGVGIATATDSLAAIKKYVFEEKSVSKAELLHAVQTDFADAPELLHKLRYEAPKLGNNEEQTDAIAVSLLDAFGAALAKKRTQAGGRFRGGTGSAMLYLWEPKNLGASPDGRRKGEAMGANFSVSLFARVKGPVSVIGSMTKPHFENAINGGPLTMEFHHGVFATEDGVEKVARLVRRFIALGGHQLQLNTVNREKLLDAQKHPEKYPHLIVRIWGWSAYFVELEREYQDHVLARQVYEI